MKVKNTSKSLISRQKLDIKLTVSVQISKIRKTGNSVEDN